MKHIIALFVVCLIASSTLAGELPVMPIEEAIRIAKDVVKTDVRFDKKFVCSARLVRQAANGSTWHSVWEIHFASQYPPPSRGDFWVEVPYEGKIKAGIYVQDE